MMALFMKECSREDQRGKHGWIERAEAAHSECRGFGLTVLGKFVFQCSCPGHKQEEVKG